MERAQIIPAWPKLGKENYIYIYIYIYIYTWRERENHQRKLDRRLVGEGGLTWSHLDSLGLTWIHSHSLGHLVSLGFLGLTWIHFCTQLVTWSHLDSLGLTWSHLVSLGFPWIHLIWVGFTLIHLDSVVLSQIHFDSFNLTWIHLAPLVLLGLTWIYVNSLGLTGAHVALGLTWIHLVSVLLAFTWTHVISLGLTRIHLDSLGLTLSCLGSHGFTWTHLVSLACTWIYVDSFDLTWIRCDSRGLPWSRLVSLGLTWTHLDSLGLTWTHTDSLGLTCTHYISQGKRENLLRQKGQGRAPGPKIWPGSHLASGPRARPNARHETISQLGSTPPPRPPIYIHIVNRYEYIYVYIYIYTYIIRRDKPSIGRPPISIDFSLCGTWQLLGACRIIPGNVGTTRPYIWEITCLTINVPFDTQSLIVICVLESTGKAILITVRSCHDFHEQLHLTRFYLSDSCFYKRHDLLIPLFVCRTARLTCMRYIDIYIRASSNTKSCTL